MSEGVDGKERIDAVGFDRQVLAVGAEGEQPAVTRSGKGAERFGRPVDGDDGSPAALKKE